MLTGLSDDAQPDELVAEARRGNTEALGRLLTLYRNYLKFLAQLRGAGHLQAKADSSDLVQETCLQAHRDFAGFRGTTEREFVAWLAQILVTKNATLHRRYATQRRDVQLERRLEGDLSQSSAALHALAASSATSPSQDAAQRERAVLVADALMDLPPSYREVMILHHFKNLTLPDVAKRMDRSLGSVQKLWARAMNAFRRSLMTKL